MRSLKPRHYVIAVCIGLLAVLFTSCLWDEDRTITVPGSGNTTPRLSRATLWDMDASDSVTRYDMVILTFTKNVELFDGSVLYFTLPVSGDSYGTNATVFQGPGDAQVSVVLGTDPVLRISGIYDEDYQSPGSSSGIGISENAGTGLIDTSGRTVRHGDIRDISGS